jgi:hypothetical protein
MKAVVISDMKKEKSIIPYALNLCKHIESEVEIIHTIDTRVQHGLSSSYADSQSISPGEKMSHTSIIEREKHQTKNKLDKILSKEASKLNYPLKINTIIENGSIESQLKSRIKRHPNSLIITNKDPDKYFFGSYKELLDVLQGLNTFFAAGSIRIHI